MKKTSQFEVVVVGNYCLDFVFSGLPGEPRLGSEIEAKCFRMVPGGTCNAALAMHRLGVSVGWAADFGNDEFSAYVSSCFQKEGFPDELFEFHDKPFRQVTVSLSYPKDRAFIAYYDPPGFVLSAIKWLNKINAKVVYIPGLFYGPQLSVGAALLKRKRSLIFMDCNSNKGENLARASIQQAFRLSDILSFNLQEALRIAEADNLEQACRRISQFCGRIIIKDGENGATAYWDGEMHSSKPIQVNVVDTTGAGDCFNAGFIKAYLSGRPVQECLDWGNIVGGLSTEGLGGVGRIVREADVLRRLSR